MLTRPALAALTALTLACGGGEASTNTDSSSASADSASDDSPTSGSTPDGLKVCVEHCEANPDCMRDGVDAGYRCIDKACQFVPQQQCTQDSDCAAVFNAGLGCAGQADCPADTACVDLGDGNGNCVHVPTPEFSCAMSGRADAMFPPFPGGAPVAVCILSSGCDLTRKVCESQCSSDAECPMVVDLACNLTTRHCECTSDETCKALQFGATSVCNQGVCGCSSDADCAGQSSTHCRPDGICGCATASECLDSQTDTCYDGYCGCSETSFCVPRLANTVIACEVP